MKRFVLLINLGILLSCNVFAAIIHVPGDQPNIQAGIDVAVDGDTVLVANGSYAGDGFRNIVLSLP